MAKLLVETTGDFQLVDITNGNMVVRHEGYSVVEQSSFIVERVAQGLLTLKGEVGDEATDAAWQDTVKQSEGDQELALAAFQSEFPAGGKAKDGSAQTGSGVDEEARKAELEAARKEAEDKAKEGEGARVPSNDTFKDAAAAAKNTKK